MALLAVSISIIINIGHIPLSHSVGEGREKRRHSMNLAVLIISIVAGSILFAKVDAESKRAICIFFILASIVVVIWFCYDPHLWIASLKH